MHPKRVAGVIHLFCAVTSLWTLAKYLELRRCVVAPGLTLPLLFLLSGVAGCLLSVNLAFGHDAAGATAGVCGLLGGRCLPVLADLQGQVWRISDTNRHPTLASTPTSLQTASL